MFEKDYGTFLCYSQYFNFRSFYKVLTIIENLICWFYKSIIEWSNYIEFGKYTLYNK